MPAEDACSICSLAGAQLVARVERQDGALPIPGRHVGAWPELTAPEQLAMLSLISFAPLHAVSGRWSTASASRADG